jgi:beta-glucanase (GH16 family)
MVRFWKVEKGNDVQVEANAEAGAPRLVWQDEFETDGLPDPQKWSYDIGDGCDLPCGCGWGNKELQYYTEARKENARVSDGFLVIEARKESWSNSGYTSARLISKGKRDMLYGRIEVRAKLPSGLRTWPAIWMLSSDDKYGEWPKSGEIDIMEHYGHRPDTIFGTVHTRAFNHVIDTDSSGLIHVEDAEDAFHTYALEWKPDILKWYVDDQLYHTFERIDSNPDHWPYDHPFHLILNLAVNGKLKDGDLANESDWPQQMLVDYVRIYKI